MAKTRQELDDLKTSFNDAVDFWVQNLNGSEQKGLNQITPAKVDKPLVEFDKLTKLIRAHTTKVGIIFKPENLRGDDVSAAYTTLENLSSSSALLITVYRQLKLTKVSNLFINELGNLLLQLYCSISGLIKELNLEVIVQETSQKSRESEVDGRLMSVGIVWSNCDGIIQLLQHGELGVLTSKIAESVTLLDDGFEEFVEWTENPEDFDDDDPFGLEISDDEDEEEEEELAKDGANPPSEENEEALLKKEELIKYSKKWVKQIELIKLLISSFKKSLPASTSSETIDNIYSIQKTLVALVDKFIADLMMDQFIDDEIEGYTTAITKNGLKLAKIAIACHKANEKKAKWYEAWEKKYNDGI